MKFSRRIAGIFSTSALAAALLFTSAKPAHARVYVSVGIAPPAIPVYVQPPMPAEGYIWTPGYWAWNGEGYVWVDGAWVAPPYENALWTPGYWAYGPGGYFWNAGYWGPTVGYYGGINYGFGYFGLGFVGGYWHGGHFWYNSAYNHFGPGWHGEHFAYNAPVHGFDGRPGGASFVHANGSYGNRGSFVNGHNYAPNSNLARGAEFNRAATPAPSHFGNAERPAYNGGNFNRGNYNSAPARNFEGNGNSAPRSFAMPSQPRSTGNYAAAQPRGNFGGGGNFHGGGAPSGGGYHGGGGGGSHGGGGGGHR